MSTQAERDLASNRLPTEPPVDSEGATHENEDRNIGEHGSTLHYYLYYGGVYRGRTAPPDPHDRMYMPQRPQFGSSIQMMTFE